MCRIRGRRVGEMRDDLAERDRVDVCAEPDRVERHAARLELARELPRAGLVLVEHQEADVPAAGAKIGQQLEQVRLGARDSRDLLRVEDEAVGHETPGARASPAASRAPRAHDSTEWPSSTRSRNVLPSAARSVRAQRGERADPVGELSGILAGEELRRIEQRVEDRVRSEHGHAACRGLVDDLVRSARAHVVHERVVGREERRDLRARNGVSEGHAPVERELGGQPLEVVAVFALLGREHGAVNFEPHAFADGCDCAHDDVEPLRR